MKNFKYSTNDLLSFLFDEGLDESSNIFIHSSWDGFTSYMGNVEELLSGIVQNFTQKGTIAMPSYFPYRTGKYKGVLSDIIAQKNKVFNLNETPTLAGIIPEEFRKIKKTLRSIDYHSVAALGKQAKFLTKDHLKSKTHWDKYSPFYKLSKINGKVLTLGIHPKFVGTILHCADSILRNELRYFNNFFTKKLTQKFILNNKLKFKKETLVHADNFFYKFNYNNHSRILKKYFDKKFYKRKYFSNLSINIYDAEYFIKRTIELARNGTVFYTQPKFIK